MCLIFFDDAQVTSLFQGADHIDVVYSDDAFVLDASLTLSGRSTSIPDYSSTLPILGFGICLLSKIFR